MAQGTLVERFGYENDDPAARFALRALSPSVAATAGGGLDYGQPQGRWWRYDRHCCPPALPIQLDRQQRERADECERLRSGGAGAQPDADQPRRGEWDYRELERDDGSEPLPRAESGRRGHALDTQGGPDERSSCWTRVVRPAVCSAARPHRLPRPVLTHRTTPSLDRSTGRRSSISRRSRSGRRGTIKIATSGSSSRRTRSASRAGTYSSS